MKILKWELKDRATAEQLLDHPWLSMPDDYNYKMSDLEYKKYKLKRSVESANEEYLMQELKSRKNQRGGNQGGAYQPEHFVGERRFECNVSELADSDSDINGGDREDNLTLESDDELEKSMSLDGDAEEKKKLLDDEYNLNISFCGGYVPNTDLKRVDKGQGNP